MSEHDDNDFGCIGIPILDIDILDYGYLLLRPGIKIPINSWHFLAAFVLPTGWRGKWASMMILL